MRAYLLSRLAEASTLRGLVLLVGGVLGVDVSDDDASAIVAGALALAGLVGAVCPDQWRPTPDQIAAQAAASLDPEILDAIKAALKGKP